MKKQTKIQVYILKTKKYGMAPVIIIDEYDTPIQEGYSKDFCEEIIGFMRNFFSGAFKDNKNISYGFLTGILRIAQESIFSGLNNLTVNSVLDDSYDSLYANDVEALHDAIFEYVSKTISFYDTGTESFYHGLMLGLVALMDNQYKVRSNRESGDGRYDIIKLGIAFSGKNVKIGTD